MTDAEKKLLDYTLAYVGPDGTCRTPFEFQPICDAAKVVHEERKPDLKKAWVKLERANYKAQMVLHGLLLVPDPARAADAQRDAFQFFTEALEANGVVVR